MDKSLLLYSAALTKRCNHSVRHHFLFGGKSLQMLYLEVGIEVKEEGVRKTLALKSEVATLKT